MNPESQETYSAFLQAVNDDFKINGTYQLGRTVVSPSYVFTGGSSMYRDRPYIVPRSILTGIDYSFDTNRNCSQMTLKVINGGTIVCDLWICRDEHLNGMNEDGATHGAIEGRINKSKEQTKLFEF